MKTVHENPFLLLQIIRKFSLKENNNFLNAADGETLEILVNFFKSINIFIEVKVFGERCLYEISVVSYTCSKNYFDAWRRGLFSSGRTMFDKIQLQLFQEHILRRQWGWVGKHFCRPIVANRGNLSNDGAPEIKKLVFLCNYICPQNFHVFNYCREEFTRLNIKKFEKHCKSYGWLKNWVEMQEDSHSHNTC